jgi:hypothetical protein
VSVTHRQLAQPQCNQLRFGLAIKLGRRGRLLALFPVQNQLEAFGDQTFAKILDRLHAAVEGLGDLDIRPSRPIGIRLEQDLSTAKFPR